jgi:protein-tyrosine-phosphatase
MFAHTFSGSLPVTTINKLNTMKLNGRITLAAFIVAVMGMHNINAAGADVLETLQPSVKQAISEFDRIDPERKKELKEAAAFIRERAAQGKPADLTFICTHNSRRSHLSQLWAQTAAQYYGLTNVTTYSGGTEVAACNIRTVRALRRAGFSIVQSSGGTNPVYLAQFSDTRPAVKMYSKLFTADENPQKNFAALFTCDHAAESCPVVKGAALRLPVLYVDPKASDDSPAEQQTYDERSQQIAREMFFMMSQVNNS